MSAPVLLTNDFILFADRYVLMENKCRQEMVVKPNVAGITERNIVM